MALEDLFQELKNEPDSDERLNKAIFVQQQALSDGNMDIFASATSLIASHHESNQDYSGSIAVIRAALETERIEDYTLIVPLVDQLIGLLLKLEDYPELEKVLRYRERFLEHKKSYQLMQKFYLAVCYEGLRENRKAIECLLEVDDTISNNNLVSKYLKLALLFLAENDYQEARAMYEHARIFDPERKNSMFSLVLSDLNYHIGNYPEAMESYQDYFLRTANRFRYLDRFILISLKLGNLDEALSFYHDYLPKLENQYSKHAKKTFYEASLQLFSHLGNVFEVALIKEKLANLYAETNINVDSYQDLMSLVQKLRPIVLHAKPRDVLLDVFRRLAEQYPFARLVFIHVATDGFVTQTFSKGLLLEKLYSYPEIKGTLIDRIMTDSGETSLYGKEELSSVADYIDRSPFADISFCLVEQVSQDIYPQGTIVALVKDISSFDRANKLIRFARVLLSDRLITLLQLTKANQDKADYRDSLTTIGCGLIRIENGIVHLLDDMVKKLFGESKDLVNFDLLQKRLSGNKIFLDDFLHKDVLEATYMAQDGFERILRFKPWHHEFTIIAIVTDITDAIRAEATLKQKTRDLNLYGLPGRDRMMTDLETVDTALSFLTVHVGNYDRIAGESDREKLEKAMERVAEKTRISARQHYHGLYAFEPQLMVLTLKTTDKRVIDRIGKEISGYDLSSFVHPDLSFRIGCFISLRPSNPDLISERIASLTHREYQSDEPVFYYGRQETIRRELANSLREALNLALADKALPLSYHPLGAWQKQEIAYLEAACSEKAFFGTLPDREEALIYHNLYHDYALLFLRSLIKDIKTFVQKTGKKTPFVYRMKNADIINHKTFQALVSEMQKARTVTKQIVICLDFSAMDSQTGLQAYAKLEEAGLRIALANFTDKLALTELAALGKPEFGLLCDLEKVPGELLKPLSSRFSAGLAYDHGESSLHKSLLTEKSIQLVKGGFFKPFSSLEAMLETMTGPKVTGPEAGK